MPQGTKTSHLATQPVRLDEIAIFDLALAGATPEGDIDDDLLEGRGHSVHQYLADPRRLQTLWQTTAEVFNHLQRTAWGSCWYRAKRFILVLLDFGKSQCVGIGNIKAFFIDVLNRRKSNHESAEACANNYQGYEQFNDTKTTLIIFFHHAYR